MSVQGKVRFGVFELDLGSGELRKSGTRLRLQEQPFQVLKALVERPGEVVTREKLQQRLWPDDTFVDFEDGLSTSVKKIRRALGDSAANPRFVETLPKRGYRFVAPVTGATAEQRGAKQRIRLLPWLAAGGVVVSLAVGWAIYSAGKKPAAAVPWEPVPFTTYQGEETNPTFSPDGERVAFQWRHEGECDIYIKLVGSESPQRLTDHPGEDSHPAWSPDGKQIAFFRQYEKEWTLRVVPSIGGPERELARGPVGRLNIRPGPTPLVAWHPGGEWIAYADWSEGSDMGLAGVSVVSGEQYPLTNSARRNVADSCVDFSVDGTELLFCRMLDLTRNEIHRMTVTSDPGNHGESVIVPVAQEDMENWVWMPDGSEVVGGYRLGGTLARLKLTRGAKASPLGIGRNARSVAYSDAANRLVYSVSQRDSNIWRLDLDESGLAGEPRAAVTATSLDHQADLSPDGSQIAFWSDRSGHREVWICDADGSNARPLTRVNGRGGISYPQWTPDGKRVVFGSSLEGEFDLYSIPVEGGKPSKVLNHPGRKGHGVYSADMTTFFFASAHDGVGETECHQAPVEGGDPVQVTEHGANACQPSLDGTVLYYSRAPDNSLWSQPLRGGEPTQLTPALAHRVAFAVWRDGVYYVPPSEDGASFVLYDFNPKTGEKRRLARIDDAVFRNCLSASEDGRQVIWSQWDLVGADLMLVEGFE